MAVTGACGGGDRRGPSVLLITLDTTRADYLSCYDAVRGHTPSIDRLAEEGTVFDLAVSTASVTPVSHASIMTGLYNHEHGVRVLFADGGYRLPEEAETLATVLRAHGYRTLAVQSAFPVSRFFGFERGFEVFHDLQAEMAEKGGDFVWDAARYQRRSDETSALALELLAQQDAAAPFFLWVHYWDPHDLARLPPGVRPRDVRPAESDMGVQPYYAEEVTFMDASIGRLLEGLEVRGLDEETMVIVVADHGQGLMDHGWPGHRLLYQEQIRVPLIVRVPGVQQVRRVEQLVRTVDIFPTVLDYLGLSLARPVSGRSLRPLLEGGPDEPRLALADQINGYDWNAGLVRQRRPLDDFLYMVMNREWKLIYRPRRFGQSELFHLASDPLEQRNLFRTRTPEAQQLLGELARASPWVRGSFAPLDEGSPTADVQETLSQLGYTGTEPVQQEWLWTCPEHASERWAEKAGCPRCGAAPILIGR